MEQLAQVKEYTPAPQGTHLAVCTGVELKTVPSRFSETGESDVYRITWELLDERMEDGNRFAVSRLYNPVWGTPGQPSNMRKLVDSWFGKSHSKGELNAFSASDLISQRALLQVIHEEKDERTFAKVNAVLPAPGPTAVPDVDDDAEEEEEGDDLVPF